MANLFFFISGEHQTLPISEVEAILKAEGFEYRISEKLTQVLLLESDAKCVEAIRHRAALTRICCKEIFNCEARLPEILGNITIESMKGFIGKESFAVRIRRVEGVSPELNRVELEGELGGQLLETVKASRVDLSNPQKTFFGVITDNRFIFGLETAVIIPKPFIQRGPRRRPVFSSYRNACENV